MAHPCMRQIKIKTGMVKVRMMIPDCQHGLEAAYTNLLQLLESEKDLEEAEEIKKQF
ncbi:unnamed protein product [Nyctereutes procyonoides]|uniref:Tubulin-specific chaperone A n=1 Tax=Nyctereutes procyonoides TaxID=34880 RepID=A0A811ZSK0_NYCPR|nr:unnamed protein product [Nyctereutes procyonoides]